MGFIVAFSFMYIIDLGHVHSQLFSPFTFMVCFSCFVTQSVSLIRIVYGNMGNLTAVISLRKISLSLPPATCLTVNPQGGVGPHETLLIHEGVLMGLSCMDGKQKVTSWVQWPCLPRTQSSVSSTLSSGSHSSIMFIRMRNMDASLIRIQQSLILRTFPSWVPE